ncbi:MAG: gliding motility-associated C-terminal domain-containing protein [Prevotellaceae bacterium]|nr:gliding motility-associated C-terminal domain-containing protein [Prevotellaceae bacterium]
MKFESTELNNAVDLSYNGQPAAPNVFTSETFELNVDSIAFVFRVKNKNNSHKTDTISYTVTLIDPSTGQSLEGVLPFSSAFIVPPLPWIEVAHADTLRCENVPVTVTVHGSCLSETVRLKFEGPEPTDLYLLTYDGTGNASPATFTSFTFTLPSSGSDSAFSFTAHNNNTTLNFTPLSYTVSLVTEDSTAFAYDVTPYKGSIKVAPKPKINVTVPDSISCDPATFTLEVINPCVPVSGTYYPYLKLTQGWTPGSDILGIEFFDENDNTFKPANIWSDSSLIGLGHGITTGDTEVKYIKFRLTNTNRSSSDVNLGYAIGFSTCNLNGFATTFLDTLMSGTTKLKKLPAITITAPDSLSCVAEALTVDIDGSCSAPSLVKLEIDDYASVKDLFTLVLNDTDTLTDQLNAGNGAMFGPDTIPSGYDPGGIKFTALSTNDHDSAKVVYFTVSVVNLDGSEIVSVRDTITLLPKPFIKLINKDVSTITAFSLGMLGCTAEEFRIQYNIAGVCYADTAKYVRLTLPADKLKYIDLEWMDGSSVYQNATYTIGGGNAVVYSTQISANTPNGYTHPFRATNTHVFGSDTIAIPYMMEIVKASDSTAIGHSYTDTIFVLPTGGVETDLQTNLGADTTLRCERVLFTVNAWDFCNSDNKVIKLQLKNVTDTNFFKLEFWFAGSTPASPAGYYEVPNNGYASGALYGMSDVFTDSTSVPFRVVNANTTAATQTVKFVLSVVDSATLSNVLYTYPDTILLHIAPLPTIAIDQTNKDTLHCDNASGGSITVHVGSSSCDNDKVLKIVIDNYATDSIAEVLALTGVDSTGVLWDATVITGNAATVTFASANLNLRDTVVPVYYTVYLANTSDSVGIVSVKDTIYLLPQPYFELHKGDASGEVITSLVAECDPTAFFLNYFVEDACYNNAAKLMHITLSDSLLRKYIDLSYKRIGSSTYTAMKLPNGTERFDRVPTGTSDSISLMITSANTFDTITRKIPFTIYFEEIVEKNTVGRTYYDTIVVKPRYGIVTDVETSLSGGSNTLRCEREEFSVSAWGFCNPTAGKAIKLQLLSEADTNFFKLEYWFNPGAPTPAGFSEVKSTDYVNGILYGMSDLFTASTSVNFRVVNTNTTAATQTVKFVLSVVDTTTGFPAQYTYPDTLTIYVDPLPTVTLTQAADTLVCSTPSDITIAVGANTCDNPKILKLVVDNYAAGDSIVGLFNLFEADGSLLNGFIMPQGDGTALLWGGGDTIRSAAHTVTLKASSVNTRDTIVPVSYTVYLLNVADSVELAVASDTIYLQPQPYVKLTDSAYLTAPFTLDTLSCDTTKFYVHFVAADKCYSDVDKRIKITLRQEFLQYVKLDYYSSNWGWLNANQYFENGVMYSDPNAPIGNLTDSTLFRITNANTLDTLTYVIPYEITLALASDSSAVGKAFKDTLVVLPYKGIKTDIPSVLLCEREKAFTLEAWDYCDTATAKLVKIELLNNNADTSVFKLEAQVSGTTTYLTVDGYSDNIVYGWTYYIQGNNSVINIPLRITNTNTTGSAVELKFIVSTVDVSTQATTYYTLPDTVKVVVAPLPEITLVAPDSLECSSTNRIDITVSASNCPAPKILQLVIDDYSSIKDLFELFDAGNTSLQSFIDDATGELWGGADTIFAAEHSVTIIAKNNNTRDSVVPVSYTVNLLNVGDSVALVSLKDTLYLKQQPYIKLTDSAYLTDPFTLDTLSCDTTKFYLHFVAEDKCYSDVDKRIRITLPDSLLQYVKLDYYSVPWGWLNANQYFDDGVMYSDPNAPIGNLTGNTWFRIANANTFDTITRAIPYEISFVLASDSSVVGKAFKDTLVVLPYKGIKTDIPSVLLCERENKFTLEAWDYCDTNISKLLKIRLLNSNVVDTSVFKLEAQVNGTTDYLTVDGYSDNIVYGWTYYIVGDTNFIKIPLRITNTNTTGSAVELKFIVSTVDVPTQTTTYYTLPDTIKVVVEPQPEIDILLTDSTSLDGATIECDWTEFDVNAILGCHKGTESVVRLKVLNPADTSYYLMQYYEGHGYNQWFDFTIGSDGTQVGPFYGFAVDTSLRFRIANTNYSQFDDQLVYQVSIISKADGTELASNHGVVTLKALTPPSITVDLLNGSSIGCDTTSFTVATVGGCIDSLVNIYLTIDTNELQYFELEYEETDVAKNPAAPVWLSLNSFFDTSGQLSFHPQGAYRLPLGEARLNLRIINRNNSLVNRAPQYTISVVDASSSVTYATTNGWFILPVIPQQPTAPTYDLNIAACVGGVAPALPVSHNPDYLELIWYIPGTNTDTTITSLSTAAVGIETYEIALRNKVTPSCESSRATFTFTVRDVPTLVVRDTAVCYGSDVDLFSLVASHTGDDTLTYWTTVVPVTGLSGSLVRDIRQSVTYTVQAEKFYLSPTGVCTSTADIKITVNPLPETPVLTPLTACQGDASPSLPTPQPGYEFVWYLADGSATTTVPTLSTADDSVYNYKVGNRDTLTGCESAVLANWSFTVYPKPVIPYLDTLSVTTFCDGGSVTIRDTVTRTNVRYRWYKDSNRLVVAPTVNAIVATESGVYTLVVVSADGCLSDESNAITVTVNPLPTVPTVTWPSSVVTSVQSLLICEGEQLTLTASSTISDASSLTYQWYQNGIAISGETGSQYTTPTTLNDTTIIYTVEAISAASCTSGISEAVAVTIIPLPPQPAAPTYDLTVAACVGSNAPALPVSHDPDHLDLKWYVPGQPNALAYPPVLSTNSAGVTTYEITLKRKSAPFCESPRATFTFEVRAVPTVVARDTTVCYGSDVDLLSLVTSHTGDDTLTYWTTVVPVTGLPGSLVQDIRQSVTYTVRAEKHYSNVPAGVCTAEATIHINVNQLPEAPILTPLTACQDDPNPSLPTPQQGYEFVWYLADGSATTTAPALSTVDDSTYNYKVGNRNITTGCASNALADWSFTVYPKPATPQLDTSSVTTFCEGGSVTISDRITRPSGTSYRWYRNGVTLNTAPTANTFVAYESGDYTLIVVSASGCPSAVSDIITVTVNPVPTVPVVTPAQSVNICEGEQVTLTAVSTISIGLISYQWYLNGGVISAATTSLYTTATLTATSTYTVVAVSAAGCTSDTSGNVVVTVNPKPTTPVIASVSNTSVCENDVPTLTTSTPVGTNTIAWYRNGVVIPFATAASYLPSTSGSYSVRFISAAGCLSEVSNVITLTVNPLPPQPVIISDGALEICQGDSVALNAVVSGGSDVVSYKWYLDASTTSIGTGMKYWAKEAGSYTVRAISSHSCESSVSGVVVVITVARPSAPIIAAASNETIVYVRKDDNTNINIANYSTSLSYQWYHNGYEISGERGSSLALNMVKAFDAGIYTVVAYSLPGCDALSNQVELIVLNTIVVPNILTPNGDNENDVLEIKGLDEYLSNELTIVNRWGNQVFYMKYYDNLFDGSNLQDGVYFYKLKLTDHNKLTTVKTGYITLKKD